MGGNRIGHAMTHWVTLLVSGVALVAAVASHWLPLIAGDVLYVCGATILPLAVAGEDT